MQVVNGYPPNFEDIAAVFPAARNPGVIFTYGERIYNPGGAPIQPKLKAHVAVHSQRQGYAVDLWWYKYLRDPAFRLEEELLAHRAEYRAFKGSCRDRNEVSRALHDAAARLSSALYGNMISYMDARRFIVVTPGG